MKFSRKNKAITLSLSLFLTLSTFASDPVPEIINEIKEGHPINLKSIARVKGLFVSQLEQEPRTLNLNAEVNVYTIKSPAGEDNYKYFVSIENPNSADSTDDSELQPMRLFYLGRGVSEAQLVSADIRKNQALGLHVEVLLEVVKNRQTQDGIKAVKELNFLTIKIENEWQLSSQAEFSRNALE